jgi:hypothetical protein
MVRVSLPIPRLIGTGCRSVCRNSDCARRAHGHKRPGGWLTDQVTTSHEKLDEKEYLVSTIHFHQTTASTPEQFIAGLTDFGPGRSQIFTNSADSYLKVHHLGAREADVTEGSGGIWERLRYDWSDPNLVKLTTTDSNVFGGASGYAYRLKRLPNGTTDVDVLIVRQGKNVRGRILSGLLGTIAKRSLEKAFVNSVKAIEARSDARATDVS